jgi:hypothetical protein
MVKVKKEYKPEEVNYVMENAAAKRDNVIASELTTMMGYPVNAKCVRAIRTQLGIVKARGRGANRILTAEEVAVIKAKHDAKVAAKAVAVPTPESAVQPQ